jgi:hypothetical protein
MARNSFKLSIAILGATVLAGAGCKNSGSSAGGSSSRDPIFGAAEKIPPQGLPVYGATKKDPLLKGATATSRSEAMAEPYRPNSGVTTAALAGAKPTPESDTLAYNRDRSKGDIVPAIATATYASGDLAERVQKQGGRMYAPVKLRSGDYEVRCAVPINKDGAMRTYSAIASTPEKAMKDLQSQIQADLGR